MAEDISVEEQVAQRYKALPYVLNRRNIQRRATQRNSGRIVQSSTVLCARKGTGLISLSFTGPRGIHGKNCRFFCMHFLLLNCFPPGPVLFVLDIKGDPEKISG